MPPVAGRHAGERRSRRPRPSEPARANLRSVGVVAFGLILALVTWALLVWVAIDAGSSVRAGASGSWVLLAATVGGAILSLFAGLLLMGRLVRTGRKSLPEWRHGSRRAPFHRYQRRRA